MIQFGGRGVIVEVYIAVLNYNFLKKHLNEFSSSFLGNKLAIESNP